MFYLHPLSTIVQEFKEFAGAVLFSVLDLNCTDCHFRLSPCCRHVTVFLLLLSCINLMSSPSRLNANAKKY
jgi:hypothetical protein